MRIFKSMRTLFYFHSLVLLITLACESILSMVILSHFSTNLSLPPYDVADAKSIVRAHQFLTATVNGEVTGVGIPCPSKTDHLKSEVD